MGKKCEFCGEVVEEVLIAVGNHLLVCDKAPFKDMDDETLRRNAVQSHILQKLLKR